jgi:aspartate/methionine/tyrosine aminotransferase
MEKTVRAARQSGKHIRAMVIINPGNPTGQCLSRETLRALLRFAEEEGGFPIIADEVYQENVYQPDSKPFISMRSALDSLGEPSRSEIGVISVHTVSKGAFGECGMRSGYLHFQNIHQGTVDMIYKVHSVQLSPCVPSQVILGCMCRPPKPGDASHASHQKERMDIIESLKRRAFHMAETFNSLQGMSCTHPEGAMYALPRVRLPPSAVAAAYSAGKAPDLFYALELLKETGICVVPGTAFGQADGTYHFRTTFLAPESQMDDIRSRFTKFHQKFMQKYGIQSKL